MADLLDYRARLGSDFSRVRFHNLRCSHATQLVFAGVHPKVAQERFWHSTVTTTLDLYGHDAGGCASRLDAAFGGTIRAIGEQKRTVGRFGEYRSVATSVAAVGPKPASYQFCRVSTVAVQRFCKPKVGGSNPSPGTDLPLSYGFNSFFTPSGTYGAMIGVKIGVKHVQSVMRDFPLRPMAV